MGVTSSHLVILNSPTGAGGYIGVCGCINGLNSAAWRRFSCFFEHSVLSRGGVSVLWGLL